MTNMARRLGPLPSPGQGKGSPASKQASLLERVE